MPTQTDLFPAATKPAYAVMQRWCGWPMVAYESTSLKKVEAEFRRREALGWPVIDIACFNQPSKEAL